MLFYSLTNSRKEESHHFFQKAIFCFQTLVELGTTLSSTELVSVVAALVGLPDDWPDLTRLVTAISTHTIDRLMSAKRHPVLLVLDKVCVVSPYCLTF